MQSFGVYLLKVFLCSGILYAWYFAALRNKAFHGYNRFFLLGSITISLIVPLINFEIALNKNAMPPRAIRLLDFSDGFLPQNTFPEHYSSPFLTTSDILAIIYSVATIALFCLLVRMLVSIHQLIKKHRSVRLANIHLVSTSNVKNTPFSFFNFVFWNDKISLTEPAGQRIFQHELVHVNENHSLDKLYINLLLCFFWMIPTFWLIRKEINIIHEFIADRKSVEAGNTSAFAEMILLSASIRPGNSLLNYFFYSPIKRRIMMLSKHSRPALNYFSRILILPLLILLLGAFTIKIKAIIQKQNAPVSAHKKPAVVEKTGFEEKSATKTGAGFSHTENKITVVIDAGHGGSDKGAINGSRYEKDIALSLVKEIERLNTNANVKIVLLRADDRLIAPAERLALVEKLNPDFLISVHVDAYPLSAKTVSTGVHVVVARDSFSQSAASKMLASALIGRFKESYGLPVNDLPLQRALNIKILQSKNFPAAIIEAGYLTNEKDAMYLLSPEGRRAFATNVLNAINDFADAKLPSPASTESSFIKYNGKPVALVIPQKSGEDFKVIFTDNQELMITREEAVRAGLADLVTEPDPRSFHDQIYAALSAKSPDLSILRVSQTSILPVGEGNILVLRNKIVVPSKNIKLEVGDDLTILPSAAAKDKYGPDAANGAIEITTHPNTGYDPVFRVGNRSSSRVSVIEFVNEKKLSVTDNYSLLSTTAYFSGLGFPKVEAKTLYSDDFTQLKSQLEKCVPGSALTFVNIKVQNRDGIRTIDEKSYLLY